MLFLANFDEVVGFECVLLSSLFRRSPGRRPCSSWECGVLVHYNGAADVSCFSGEVASSSGLTSHAAKGRCIRHISQSGWKWYIGGK